MSINGQTLHEAGGFLIAIFPRRGGHAPELDNADHLLGLGRTLGRMHGVGRAKDFDKRIDYSLQRWLVEPIRYLAENWIPNELQPAWNTLGKDLSRTRQRAHERLRSPAGYSPTWRLPRGQYFVARRHATLCRLRRLRDRTCYSGSVDVFIRRPQPT